MTNLGNRLSLDPAESSFERTAEIQLESRTALGAKMLSYSRGPDQPLWEMTIGQVLDRDRRTLGR